jgi:hypothetical protein
MNCRLDQRTHLSLIGLGLALLALTALPNPALGQQETPTTPAAQPTDGAVAATTSAPPVPDHGAFNWQDVPNNQPVSVDRASFDQGGFQIYSKAGATVVVPFVDENLNAMKFGRSETGQTYFVNDGASPILYLSGGAYLESAMEQGARWYPITRDFDNASPVYIDLAPNWNAYLAMGWYPGMVVYGGLWATSLNAPFVLMPGYYTRIYGRIYPTFFAYRTYTVQHPSVVQTEAIYTNYGTRALGAWNLPSRQSLSGNHTPHLSSPGVQGVGSGSVSRPLSAGAGVGRMGGGVSGNRSVGTVHNSTPMGTLQQSSRLPFGGARNGGFGGGMQQPPRRPVGPPYNGGFAGTMRQPSAPRPPVGAGGSGRSMGTMRGQSLTGRKPRR